MGQQLELVSRCSSLFQDLEGSDALVVKLLLWSWQVKVCGVEPGSITDMVFMSHASLLVVLLLHSASGFFESLLGLLVDLGHVVDEGFGGWVSERQRLGGVRKDSWVSAIQNHEWTFAGCTINSVVVCELSKREPVTPVSLSVAYKDAQVLFNFLVDSFSLAICLWMEGCQGVRCDVKHLI